MKILLILLTLESIQNATNTTVYLLRSMKLHFPVFEDHHSSIMTQFV